MSAYSCASSGSASLDFRQYVTSVDEYSDGVIEAPWVNFPFAVLNRPMSLNRMSEVRSGVFLDSE